MKRAVFMRIAVHPVMLWLGGALGALAMPPFDATIFLVPMMMQAVWALDSIARQKISRRDQLKQGFWFGWLLGFGYFTAGLWWLASHHRPAVK